MQQPAVQQNDNKHVIGGIMSIVCGALGVLGLFIMIFIIILIRYSFNQVPAQTMPGVQFDVSSLITIIYGAMGIFSLFLGILGIVGGAAALRRQHWGLALAGAIAGVFTFFPCGIVAIIFIAQARPEFIKPPLFNVPGM
jgi:hypothetical protein